MKPHGSILVVKKWHDMHTDLVLRCFDNPEGMNSEDLPSWCNSRVHELANGSRLGTTMPSLDLSGAWVIMCG
jgi:hypothetical protein